MRINKQNILILITTLFIVSTSSAYKIRGMQLSHWLRTWVYAKEDIYLEDLKTVNQTPYTAGSIGDAWLSHGDTSKALEFHTMFIKNYPQYIKKVSAQWVYYEPDENSQNSYAIAKETFIDRAYSMAFNSLISIKKQNNDAKYYSIANHIINKIHIDPEYLQIDDTNINTIRDQLKSIFNELIRSHDILFQILHAVALHSKENPNLQIHLFCKHPQGKSTFGTYHGSTEHMDIFRKLQNKDSFKGTLIHELTHHLMYILYDNLANPYIKNDKERSNIFKSAYTNVQNLIKEGYRPKNYLLKNTIEKILNPVQKYYKPHEHSAEYIVRLPQAIAEGTYEHLKVQELFKDIKAYWDDYILPDMFAYVNKQRHLDNFISEAEIEDPVDSEYLENIFNQPDPRCQIR